MPLVGGSVSHSSEWRVVTACRVVGKMNEKMYGKCSVQPLAPFRHSKITDKF